MKKTPNNLCATCDCVADPDEMFYSSGGRCPFCFECWGSLTDADQTLLINDELARAEAKIEELQREIEILMATKSA